MTRAAEQVQEPARRQRLDEVAKSLVAKHGQKALAAAAPTIDDDDP